MEEPPSHLNRSRDVSDCNERLSFKDDIVGESGALRSGVWFRANNLMIMMTQHNFCLLFD